MFNMFLTGDQISVDMTRFVNIGRVYRIRFMFTKTALEMVAQRPEGTPNSLYYLSRTSLYGYAYMMAAEGLRPDMPQYVKNTLFRHHAFLRLI
jgi:hypothetical protein